jgi:hypothetical protein
MTELTIISADDAYKKIKTGRALLVSAYAEEEKFLKYNLAGAISLKDLQSRLAAITKKREIIFYCA